MNFLYDPSSWERLSSIATVLGLIILVPATIVALGQLKEMTKARHLEAMLHVYDMIGSIEARRHKRFIYTELRSRPENLTDEEREIVENMIATFDRIGRLVESGLIPKDELLQGHSSIFLKTWGKLEPYINYQRRVIGKRHAQNFEMLVKISREYDRRHYPEDIPTIIESSTKHK